MHVHPAAARREERVRRSRLGGRKPAAPEEGRESRSHTFVVSRGRLRRASLMRRGEASWASSRRGASGSESLRRQKKVRESSSHTFVVARTPAAGKLHEARGGLMGELERTRGGPAPPGPPGTPLACASGAGRYAQGASGAAERSQSFLSAAWWRRAPLALRSGNQRTGGAARRSEKAGDRHATN